MNTNMYYVPHMEYGENLLEDLHVSMHIKIDRFVCRMSVLKGNAADETGVGEGDSFCE